MVRRPLPIPAQATALTGKDGQPSSHGYRYLDSLGKTLEDLYSQAVAPEAFQMSSMIEYPDNKDYRIFLKAETAMTITATTTRTSAGTATVTFKINSTALGGTANSASTSEQTQAHESANVVAAGDDIVLTVSAVSGAEDLAYSIVGKIP